MILLSTTKKAGSLFGGNALLWAALLLFPFLGTTQTWTAQASGSTQYLPSSWGIDANNVWIAGWGGTILKWDGSSWTAQASGTTALLGDVWGLDANNVWAVGSNGTILKWNGSSWTAQASGTTEFLQDIWGSDANNIWAVGHNGTILKWDGSSWTAQASGTTQNLYSIWGADANNIWAGGVFGTIAKWDGSTWTIQTQSLGAGGGFLDIWGSDANNVWAATGAAILKWDGNTWAVQPTPSYQFFRGVWGIDPYNVWAVGENGNIHKWDGISWTPQTSGTTQILVSIWGSDANNVWITGANGTILYSSDQPIAPPCGTTYYLDEDGDNYGTGTGQDFCDDPGTGWALQVGDCDDTDPNINPDAPEVCDGVDNNCINGIDEGNVCCPSGDILYVKATATGGNNDGTSWADAFIDLQDALASTCPGITQIWVAEGAYKPSKDPFGNASPTDPRDKTFYVRDGIGIYGGFAGTETMLSARNIAANTTTLSGDIGAVGVNTDNCYHVVLASAPSSGGTGVTIDGFTITGGNANGFGLIPVNGSTMSRFVGGGIYTNLGTNTLTNNTLSGNSASFFGGGIYTINSTNILTNNTLSGNSAGSKGGGIRTVSSNTNPTTNTLTNNTLSGNSAANGGGIYMSYGTNILTNNIFSDNLKGLSNNVAGADIENDSSFPSALVVTYCLIQANSNYSSGTGIIYNQDPLFTDATNGDFTLQECSPCINTGNNAVWTATGLTTDAAGGTRPLGVVDMGAYEYQSTLTLTTYYVDADGDDYGTGPGQDFCDDPGIGWVLQAGDCDDTDSNINPDALEACNDVDDNCDNQIDEGNVCCPSGDILYVKATATGGNNDGTSWADAFIDLQDALASTCSGVTEIWVAEGIYKPTTGTDRNATFQLKNGVALYGGFEGDETMLSERDWATYVTTLSGDIGNSSDNSDNSYTLVIGSGTDATAVLDGFTITMGNANDTSGDSSAPNRSGGGMYNSDGSPTVTNCTFSGNATLVFGGGMFNYNNSSPTVTNCTFSGNTATHGGGMYNFISSSPMVTNTTFSGNTTSQWGGGMFNNNNSSPTVTNSTFLGNTAGTHGGGMYNFASSSPTLTNTTFSGNTASQWGGGMFNRSNSSPEITNCTFSGNSAEFGGGMYNTNSSPEITNSTFSGNTASRGGGIYNRTESSIIPPIPGSTGGSITNSSPTVTNCIFSGNTASQWGGGIYNSSSSPTVTNSIIWNNTAAGSTTSASASVYNNSSTPAFSYSLIANSRGSGTGWVATIGTDGGNNIAIDPLFVAPLAPGLSTGGDYRLQECSPAIDAGADGVNTAATDLDGNDRTFEAIPGAPTIDLGAYEYQATLTLTTYYVDADGDNYGTGTGQDFCENPGTGWVLQAGDCDDTNSNINPDAPEACNGVDDNCDNQIDEGNVCCPSGHILYVKATANGGNNDGTSWADAFTDLQDALASTCSGITEIWVAEGTYKPTATADRSVSFMMKNDLAILGGFPNTGNPDLNDRDWTIYETILSGDIGTVGTEADNSIHVISNNGLNASAQLDGFVISYGQATGDGSGNASTFGGGMYNLSSSPTIANCTFIDNIGIFGGGMYNDGSTPSLENCAFVDNFSSSGSGMYNIASSPTLSNCDFMDNFSTISGGGMYNENNSTPEVSACTFTGNGNGEGAGMFNKNSSPIVTDCLFSGNLSSSRNGGGMFNDSSSPVITNCSFIGNSSIPARGGGMWNTNSSPEILNSIFAQNVAEDGGGMYNSNNSSPTLTNSVFDNNSAVRGIAVYNTGSTFNVINSTFSRNNGGADGIISNFNSSVFNADNFIFWNNAISLGEAIVIGNTSSGTINKAIITGGCPVGAICADVLNVDPLFVSPTDFRLQACSPAIDAGNDGTNTTATDLDGNNRTFEAIPGTPTIDLGAYEFQGTVPTPTPFCASNLTVQLEANLTVTVTAAQIGDPSDGCAPLSFLIDGGNSLTFDCDQVGPQTVTLQVTDLFMNVETTTCSFTVADDVNTCCDEPVANCQAFTAVLVGNSVTITPADVDAGSTADCGLQALSVTPNTFSCADVGTPQTVTLTITDINGDSDACQATITVVDGTDPVLVCPTGGITVDNDPGACFATVANLLVSATDNCTDNPTITYATSPDLGFGNAAPVQFPVGTTAVTAMATDAAGKTASCTFDVTVNDAEAPTAVCQDITVNLETSGVYILDPTELDGGSTDNCGALGFGIQTTAFDCDDVGQTFAIELTVSDNSGNFDFCTAQVTVGDNFFNCNAPPVAVCQPVMVAADANCMATVAAAEFDGGSTDEDMDILTFTVSPEGPYEMGTTNVTLTVSDGLATSQCMTTVTVTDATPPTITCPDDVVVECTEDTEPASTGTATGSDNCGTAMISMSDSFAAACGNTGVITRTWTATDAAGNPASCNQIITIVDTTPPTIVVPPDETVECGESTDPSATGTAIGTDGCGTVSVSYLDSSVPGCGNTEVITRMWTVTDACGNPSSSPQIITVVDTTPPSITCPADAMVECGMSTDPSATGMATGSDVCGTVEITFSDSSAPGCGNTETITRTWTATDECGNPNTCVQIITIVDTTPPSITCPADAMVECGMSTDPSATGMATGSDVCGTVEITFSDSAVPGCGNTETITRTWTATDECGNPSTCVQIITVVDTTPPSITCPADATVECGMSTDPSATGMATGSDVCGTVSITFSDSAVPGCGNTETITRTWTATDECGNLSTCEQIITVVDTTPPVFDAACQVDLTFTTEGGDLCPAEAMISLTEGEEIDFDDTWTVGGNEVPNLAGCISDICSTEDEQVITVDDITITDDGTCGRNIAVTFIATDPCGNDSEPFVLNYTFLDDTAPVFNEACMVNLVVDISETNLCPTEVTISLNEGDEITVNDIFTVGGIAVDNLAGCVFDNCTVADELNITVDDITVTDNSSCSRTISVTFIADDGCGNFSEPFTYTYTVLDTKGPAVSFNGIPDGGTYVVECNVADPNWDPLIETTDLTIIDACSAVDFSTLTVELTQLYDGPCVNNLLTRWQQVFTVQDACGNETVYTLFTEIVDTTAPVFNFSPTDYTVECDAEIGLPNLQAFDSCSEVVYNFTEVRTDGDCPNNYTMTHTWTATDGCGNSVTEVQVVTFEDTTPPVIEFVDGYINQYESGQDVFVECSEYGNISQLIANSAYALDNCSSLVEVDYELEDLGTFNCLEVGYSGHLISTWRSKDECGNESVATINWFLVDETAPVFQGIPEDLCASTLPPVPNVQAVDDCEFATLAFAQSDPIDCEGGQYVERTWTAMDLCGNTATATQRITLSDASSPIITIDYPGIGVVADGDQIELPIDCNQPIELSVADLEAAIQVEDGCSATTFSIELNLMDEGNCREDGYVARYRLNVTAADACGNTANLGLVIDFVDTTPPVIMGAAEITVNCGEDIPTLIAEDACGDIDMTTYVDSAPIMGGCANDPQVIERVWTVSDVCGNTTTFTQTINVVDLSGPVFSGVPADACNTTTLTANVTAFDACSGMAADVTLSEVMSNEPGCGQVLTRTWSATDACGNTSTATQQVFFMDNNAPLISFSHPLLVGLQSGGELFLSVGDGFGDPNDPLIFTADAVSVTDNCAANIASMVNVSVTVSEDCAADGFLAQYRYRWTATDPCGNTAKIALTVFYIDGNAPDFFNVPADVTVFCAAVPEVANVQASDDYDEEVDVIFTETQASTPNGVLITRTWTATDDCGNTSEATQEILVANNDLTASFSFASVIECNSQNNRLGVTVNGGTPPYSYAWQLTSPLEDGYITSDPTRRGILFTMGFITQTFTVIITDANGCELAAQVTIVCDFSGEEGLVSSGGNGLDEMSVYPNPATEQVRVKAIGVAEEKVTVSIYSLLGQVVYQNTFEQWPIEGVAIDTRVYPAGTYLLRLETPGAEPMIEEIVILR